MNARVVAGYYNNVILILLSEYLILINSYCNNRNPEAIHHHRSLSPYRAYLSVTVTESVSLSTLSTLQSTSSSASDIDKQNRRKRRIRRSVVRLATQKIRCIERFYLAKAHEIGTSSIKKRLLLVISTRFS